MTKPKRGKASVYYVDNKKFYEEMKKYIDNCRECEEQGDDYPRIPNYIGECFYKISTRLATKPNFASYSYKEEMIGDAIENYIHYVKSFNPDKYMNPFAYFTQVAWNSFIHRINKEKRHQYIKYKSFENIVVNNQNFISQVGDSGHIIPAEFHENTQKFISSFEENLEKAKKKKEEKREEKKALEKFIEED